MTAKMPLPILITVGLQIHRPMRVHVLPFVVLLDPDASFLGLPASRLPCTAIHELSQPIRQINYQWSGHNDLETRHMDRPMRDSLSARDSNKER